MPIILNGTTGITTPGITNTGPFTFQGVVELPAGAVGAPSLTTTGDTNTGIYFPAANQVAIATDGAQRVLVNATGNVGIGTTSPSEKLNVVGIIKASGTINSLMIENRDDSAKTWEWYAQGTGSTGFFGLYKNHNTVGTPLVVSDTGNVGIGTTSPTGKLDIAVSSTMGTYGPGTINLKLRNTNTSETNSGSVDFVGYSGNSTSPYPWALISAEKQTAAGDTLYGGKLHFWTTSAGANGEVNSGSYKRLTINANGNVSLQGGSADASGVGVTFPATQVASSNANCLDDYEEGTYTPTVVVDSGTPSYNYQQGYYTKIGRQVFGGGIIGVTNSNTLTGNIRISIPFTASAGSYGYTGGTVSDGSGFTFPISNGFYNVYLQANNSDSNLTYIGVGTTATTVTYTTSGIGASWYLRFMFSYYT